MHKEEEALLDRLRDRVQRLLAHERDLRERVASLEGQLTLSEQRREELEEQNQRLSAQYANLKIAKTIELSEEDTLAARRRFASLVRQVDKCIALLNN